MSATLSIRSRTNSAPTKEVLPGGAETCEVGEQVARVELEVAREEIKSLRKQIERSRALEDATILRASEFTPGPNPMEVFRVADHAAFRRLWDTHLGKVVE